ncbi:MAG: quinolinate synthase NadA [Acidobacteria bacterium]|nr:quinolinate synthase NadA [Acidobacteriota bacterium]NIM60148.1 quinolinate synthase NadA [Acidobacteriota bacterium]NIO57817.1 quinolinate synthase NadA [Acidobacteriota bacterium]NIQ28826.1 quinolinate synthase NadA [Acidobacteriota bacterium]NIQ83284.1 quinolinate synthase NadA [Acidobacteriota bacterium]
MSVRGVFDELKDKLRDVVPEAELRIKAELADAILRLKRERNAVILGHNYMEPALFHSVPDYTGDSLELCRAAARTSAETIVFCGVRFMAETAKILNPAKTVLIPSPDAGCSLAASIDAGDVRELKRRFPGVPVVVYINTYADVKAEADYCCTSGNAVDVVRSIESDTVIFVPDEYLAANVAGEVGMRLCRTPAEVDRPASDGRRTLIGWPGRCEVHDRFRVQDVESARRQFPDVLVLAHPECRPEVIEAADFAGSTSAMIRRVRDTDAASYLLLTECSMGDNIIAENPQKKLVRICSVRCPHMNEITLEQTLATLEKKRYEIDVPEPIRTRAARSIERMLTVA